MAIQSSLLQWDKAPKVPTISDQDEQDLIADFAHTHKVTYVDVHESKRHIERVLRTVAMSQRHRQELIEETSKTTVQVSWIRSAMEYLDRAIQRAQEARIVAPPVKQEVDPDQWYEMIREERAISKASRRYTAELYAIGDLHPAKVVI